MAEMIRTYDDISETMEGFRITKIGYIPNDWEVYTVSDVFKFLRTNSLSRSQLSNETLDESSIFNIHYGDIHSSFKYEILDLTKESSLPKVIDNKLIKSKPDYLKDGDLVMADASEDYEGLCDCVELKNVNGIKLVSGLHTFALRGKETILSNGFKSYLFKNNMVVKSIYRIATGISVLGVSKGNLSKIQIPIPPLPEQQKIASILSDWDEAIETTQILIEKLELRKKGLMQQLLTGKTRLAWFDKDWEEYRIGEVTTKFSNRNKQLKDVRVYSVTNDRGFILQSDMFAREVAGNDLTGYKIIEKNDFAYNPARVNVGSIALFEDEIGIISSLYVCFRTNKKLLDKYLLNLIETAELKHKIIRYGEGGVRVYLWYYLFEAIKIKIPSVDEQKAILVILDLADLEIEQHRNHLEHLQSQKKGLMQQLLTGKIRVKV